MNIFKVCSSFLRPSYRPWKSIYLDRLMPSRPSTAASSMRGVIIFSIISVMTEKVGSTMKSMNPVRILIQRKEKLCDHFGFSVHIFMCLCCFLNSPIWDWATMVDVRSQRGENGSPSSASLSPCNSSNLSNHQLIFKLNEASFFADRLFLLTIFVSLFSTNNWIK